jgi:hypothetical protein
LKGGIEKQMTFAIFTVSHEWRTMNFLGVVPMAFQHFSLYIPIFGPCKIGKPNECSLNFDSS